MDIHLICALFDEEDHEILDAWTEWTLEDNPDGFAEKLKKFKEEYPKADIRTAVVEVSDDFFDKVFAPARTKGELKGTE